jgi:uncharacterized protein YbjT (DUF2867 family)
MATILVTGGTGTLGRRLVPRLLAAGSDVRVLSRRARRDGDPAGADWVVGDLRAGSGLADAVRGAAVVVHCASDFRRPRRDLPAARNLIAAAADGLLAPSHADGRIGFGDFLREHVSPAARSTPYGRLRGGRR